MKCFKTFVTSNNNPMKQRDMMRGNQEKDSDASPALDQVPSSIDEIALDRDLNQIFTALNGRLQFGTATTGYDGVNVQGKYKQFTTAAANAEVAVAHGLGYVPNGRIIVWQDVAGSLYQSPSTGTAWNSTNAYFKSDAATVTFMVFFY